MAQLSRPFQIALIALGVFVLAWFAVLHRPGGSSASSSPPSASPAAGSAASRSGAATSSSVSHGSGSALGGFSRDVQRAHGAAAEVESNGREVQSRAVQGSGEATGASATRTGAAQRTPHARSGSAAAAPSHSKPTTAEAVAAELAHGKTVLLLFWNPHSFDDDAVAIETALAAHRLGHSVVVHYARAKQVNSFGSITRNIQVYQTPTLLIINPKLQVTTLTGLTDGYSIEQAVAEARK